MWMVVMIQSELKLLTALSTKVGQKYVDGSDDPVGIETQKYQGIESLP